MQEALQEGKAEIPSGGLFAGKITRPNKCNLQYLRLSSKQDIEEIFPLFASIMALCSPK